MSHEGRFSFRESADLSNSAMPERLPHLNDQLVDCVEMAVARHQRELVLGSESGDPDIVLRDRPPPRTQSVLDFAIQASRDDIAAKDCILARNSSSRATLFTARAERCAP